jgi:glutaredoxin
LDVRHQFSHEAILYTRQGCCLCDLAKSLLEKYRFSVREIDIDADPILQERYNDCVPVVLIDGRERFRGRISEVLLRRFLRAKP